MAITQIIIDENGVRGAPSRRCPVHNMVYLTDYEGAECPFCVMDREPEPAPPPGAWKPKVGDRVFINDHGLETLGRLTKRRHLRAALEARTIIEVGNRQACPGVWPITLDAPFSGMLMSSADVDKA